MSKGSSKKRSSQLPIIVVDAKNLLCPLPIMRAEEAMRKLAVGEFLEIHATDPGMINDLPAWSSVNGHEVLEIRKEGRVVIGLVEKKG